MEALNFLQNYNRMCSTIDKCSECPAGKMKCCELSTDLSTDEQAKLVEIVEKWAKEHPDKDKTETSWEEIPLANRLMDLGEDLIATAIAREKTINSLVEPEKGVIEWAYYYVKQFLWRFYDGMDDSEKRKYFDAMADIATAIRRHAPTLAATPQPEPAPAPTQTPAPEPKRTRKDLFLAAFPDACVSLDGIPDACPLSLDKHYDCGKFANCLRCKRAHWLAEAEGN